MTPLTGAHVTLRLATPDDVPVLAYIRRQPAVFERWGGGEDLAATITAEMTDAGVTAYVIEFDDVVVGYIQWEAESDPDYRRAGIDIYVEPAHHGRGLGTDAVRTLARHIIDDHGHHRITIDPAADNVAAIRSYAKVGFKPVGIMRAYERGPDGTFHDNLLMDLLAGELLD